MQEGKGFVKPSAVQERYNRADDRDAIAKCESGFGTVLRAAVWGAEWMAYSAKYALVQSYGLMDKTVATGGCTHGVSSSKHSLEQQHLFKDLHARKHTLKFLCYHGKTFACDLCMKTLCTNIHAAFCQDIAAWCLQLSDVNIYTYLFILYTFMFMFSNIFILISIFIYTVLEHLPKVPVCCHPDFNKREQTRAGWLEYKQQPPLSVSQAAHSKGRQVHQGQLLAHQQALGHVPTQTVMMCARHCLRLMCCAFDVMQVLHVQLTTKH